MAISSEFQENQEKCRIKPSRLRNLDGFIWRRWRVSVRQLAEMSGVSRVAILEGLTEENRRRVEDYIELLANSQRNQ